MRNTTLLTALLLALPSFAASATAALSGKVVIQGRIEKVKQVKKFDPYAGVYADRKPAAELPQELIVYLEGGALSATVSKKTVKLSQKDRNFSASIVPVLPGGEVEISNDDSIRHHIRSKAKPWAFNLKPKAPGETVVRSFEAAPEGGLGVAPVYCDIHSNMRAHVLVMPSSKWQLLPESGGNFKLDGLPAGTYTLTAWHPTLKPKPQKLTLKKGEQKRVTLVLLGKQD